MFHSNPFRLAQHERHSHKNVVWSMYVATYHPIGMNYLKKEDLLNDSLLWDVVFHSDTIIAIQIFRQTVFGLKSVAIATNQTQQGKWAGFNLFKSIDRHGVYGELSGNLEVMANSLRMSKVKSDRAKMILGKPIIPLDDGFSYLRYIKALNKLNKETMFGQPLI